MRVFYPGFRALADSGRVPLTLGQNLGAFGNAVVGAAANLRVDGDGDDTSHRFPSRSRLTTKLSGPAPPSEP